MYLYYYFEIMSVKIVMLLAVWAAVWQAVSLTAAGEIKRMGDGVVAIDAERHQHVGGRVGDQNLARHKNFS